MAMTTIQGQCWSSLPCVVLDTNSATIDAAGESVGAIGYLELEAGASGSKVLSAAGSGSIQWRVGGTITFANAGTTVRVGVQDVASTGLEDGTFDVKGDLVGGTDTITASTYKNVVMGTGTKTMAAGDLIAIVIETVSRAGADSVQIRRVANSLFLNAGFSVPYGTLDNGTLVRNVNPLAAVITFDDGTVGWIRGIPLTLHNAVASTLYNSGSTPDEYIGTFQPRVPMRIEGIGAYVGQVAQPDDFELILYSDPFGTPAVVEAVAQDGDLQFGGGIFQRRITPVTLSTSVVYGVAVRPTTVNNITINYYDLGSAFANLKKAGLHFGTSLKVASRTNQTGAFTEVQTYYVPLFTLDVNGHDDAVSAGGGLLRHPGMAGGLHA